MYGVKAKLICLFNNNKLILTAQVGTLILKYYNLELKKMEYIFLH